MSGRQDDSAEKNFEPTPRRLEEARKRGDVPRSTDATAAAALLGLLVVLSASGSDMAGAVSDRLAALVAGADRPALSLAGPRGGALLAGLAADLAPLFAVPAGAALAAILAQRAFVLAPSRLEPKIERISPILNARNKYGPTGLVEFAKSFARLVLVCAALGLYLAAQGERIVGAQALTPQGAVAELGVALVGFLGVVVVIAIGIGGIDLAWQGFDHRRKLRMSRRELLDEMKSSEGDPHLKQARRQRGQELATNRMLGDVPRADVVIVNPTRFAVALHWSREPGTAPVCVAKGTGEIAARIRAIAAEAGVPIRRDPPTARAIHALVDIGAEVPPRLYAAVAAAIRFAEAARARRAG